MRNICYVSGTRADFGLMKSTLQAIHRHPGLKLNVLITGMHLLPGYGETWREIADCGLPITDRIKVELTGHSGDEMSIAVGEQIIGFTKALKRIKPDILMLLGDRGEMLAGAIAALHLNIPIVHIHGGELSGTIDESVRHAITKLSHYHFTSTEGARQRLIKMGEIPEHIFVTGAPGLDGLTELVTNNRLEQSRKMDFDPSKPIALLLFHPVVQLAHEAGSQINTIIDALNEVEDLQILALMPNADAGGYEIGERIEKAHGRLRTVTHLPRQEFLNWMAIVDFMIGNSSSGIIEAATFNTPVMNIGERQAGRERNINVHDVNVDKSTIKNTAVSILKSERQEIHNIYGDGHAGNRIIELLDSLPLNNELLLKHNAY